TAAHLLSSHETEMQLHLHYGALPLGLTFVATTMALASLARSSRGGVVWQWLRVEKEHRVVLLAGILFASQPAGAVFSGPFGLKFDMTHYTRSESHTAAVKQILELVPPRASVAAQ